MSGSGGYYKYRCKNWLTYNCPYWVWVNGASCVNCIAQGRCSGDSLSPSVSQIACVPQFNNGLQYTTKEVSTPNFLERLGECGLRERPDQLDPFRATYFR